MDSKLSLASLTKAFNALKKVEPPKYAQVLSEGPSMDAFRESDEWGEIEPNLFKRKESNQ